MFATMILVLPSIHRGGELVVRHLGREVVFDQHPEEPSEVGFVAFYADCLHEVRPIISGNRVALVYSLRFLGNKRLPKPPDNRTEQRRITEHLRQWAGSNDSPDKLIVPLEHAYTPAELSFEKLKGRDAAVASVLVGASERAISTWRWSQSRKPAAPSTPTTIAADAGNTIPMTTRSRSVRCSIGT